MKKALLGILILTLLTTTVFAAEPLPSDLKGVGIDEKLGQLLPKDLQFTNENGQQVKLEALLKTNKVTILNLVYFNCPMLCNLVLTGLTESLDGIKKEYPVGQGYQILSLSIDPKDTPQDAQKFKQNYIQKLNQPNAASDWHFWVGNEVEIQKIAAKVGFKYGYNPQTKEYAHAAVQMIITPEGKISRYLYGTQYKPLDLKLSLIEAKKEKTISTIERFMLFCYNYEPHAKGYVLHAINLMKIAGGITVLLLAGLIFWMTKKYKNTTEEGLGS